MPTTEFTDGVTVIEESWLDDVDNAVFVTIGTKADSGAITNGEMTMATSRLLGRTTASTGAIEEITVGTGLSLSGGSLTATGSGTTGTLTAGTSVEMSPIASSSTASAAHGFNPSYPDLIEMYIECTSTDAGYAVGDRLKVEKAGDIVFGYNATNVFMATEASISINVAVKTGGSKVAITLSKWKAVIVPYIVN